MVSVIWSDLAIVLSTNGLLANGRDLKRECQKGAKAAIIDLIQKFGSDKHKLANLPVRARAIMDAKRATTNNSETNDK